MRAQISPGGAVVRFVADGTPIPEGWIDLPCSDTGASLQPGSGERLAGPIVTVTEVAVTRVWTVEPIPQEEVAATLKKEVADAVQRHLDVTVQARGYESIHTCVTYADEPAVPRFQVEGQAARAWRSAVWAACYAALDAVVAGERAPLTPKEMVAELPVIRWPD